MSEYQDINCDPRAIANEFLDLGDSEGESVSPLRLQKLIYYAYGWCLALRNSRLFREGIQAWKYGPVVPSVYYEFREYGDAPITGRALTPMCEPVQIDSVESVDQAQFIHGLIGKVWREYKRYSATQLATATHRSGTPWQKTIAEHGGQIMENCRIDDTLIQDYFLALKAK